MGNTSSTSTSTTTTTSISNGSYGIVAGSGGSVSGVSINLGQHLTDPYDLLCAFISFKNDLPDPLNIEIRTPGGIYFLGDRYAPPGEAIDSKLLKGTYDIVIISAQGKKTLSSVVVADDIEITASDIFDDNTSVIISDSKATITFDAPVSALFSEEGLEGYVKIQSGSADDEVKAVLRQLRASGAKA